jgi:hypothetical protein
MLQKNLANTVPEHWAFVCREYRKGHPGRFSDDGLLDWALKKGYVDLPRPNPRAILRRQLKGVLRSARIRDPQGRKVREFLPVRTDAVDMAGNKVFQVIWDHIHEMSLEHALTAFDQRDANINRQKRSARRDLHSCLENNPNVEGHGSQFLFDFMTEGTEPQVVEEIRESKTRIKPR